MPIYEYQCKACGHQFEELQKVSEPALTVCPKCGKAELDKLMSHTSFQLKGTGWYATDFKDSGKKAVKDDVKSGDATPAEPKKEVDAASTPATPAAPKKETDAD